MTERTIRERLLDQEIQESWAVQAQLAWQRYLDDHREDDPIQIERIKSPFINGFMAASKLPASSEVSITQCLPLDPGGIIHLSRLILPYIMSFGHHANVAPGDMMAALLICITTVGRQMHPTFSNIQVFEVFAAECKIILAALDRMQSSGTETKH